MRSLGADALDRGSSTNHNIHNNLKNSRPRRSNLHRLQTCSSCDKQRNITKGKQQKQQSQWTSSILINKRVRQRAKTLSLDHLFPFMCFLSLTKANQLCVLFMQLRLLGSQSFLQMGNSPGNLPDLFLSS